MSHHRPNVLIQGWRARCASGQAILQRAHIGLHFFLRIYQVDEHRWRSIDHCAPFLLDRAQRRPHIIARRGQHQRRAVMQRRQQSGRKAKHMKQRIGQTHAMRLGVQTQSMRDLGATVDQIEVAHHHRLRFAGGARRELNGTRIVGLGARLFGGDCGHLGVVGQTQNVVERVGTADVGKMKIISI